MNVQSPWLIIQPVFSCRSDQLTFLSAARSSSPCSRSQQTPSARGRHGPCSQRWAWLRSGDTETPWWRSQGHRRRHLHAAPRPGWGSRRWRWPGRHAPGGRGGGTGQLFSNGGHPLYVPTSRGSLSFHEDEQQHIFKRSLSGWSWRGKFSGWTGLMTSSLLKSFLCSIRLHHYHDITPLLMVHSFTLTHTGSNT